MTADGHFKVPTPVNEPIRAYAPGDPNRKSLKARLAELTDARTDVPMQIGGEKRWGASKSEIRSPHRKELSIAQVAEVWATGKVPRTRHGTEAGVVGVAAVICSRCGRHWCESACFRTSRRRFQIRRCTRTTRPRSASRCAVKRNCFSRASFTKIGT